VLLVALGREPPSDNTGAYCRARAKLPVAVIRRLACEVADRCERHPGRCPALHPGRDRGPVPSPLAGGTGHPRHQGHVGHGRVALEVAGNGPP
jgi:hypothetical protein